MGQSTRGIYPDNEGAWQVDKWWGNARLRKRGFSSFEEAEHWLIRQLDELRVVVIHGERPNRTFDVAAAHYLLLYQAKTSIVTETCSVFEVAATERRRSARLNRPSRRKAMLT